MFHNSFGLHAQMFQEACKKHFYFIFINSKHLVDNILFSKIFKESDYYQYSSLSSFGNVLSL